MLTGDNIAVDRKNAGRRGRIGGVFRDIEQGAHDRAICAGKPNVANSCTVRRPNALSD